MRQRARLPLSEGARARLAKGLYGAREGMALTRDVKPLTNDMLIVCDRRRPGRQARTSLSLTRRRRSIMTVGSSLRLGLREMGKLSVRCFRSMTEAFRSDCML